MLLDLFKHNGYSGLQFFRYLGAVLTGQNNRENLIVVGGVPRTGKSLLLALVNEVVDIYNVPTAVKLDAAQIVGYAQGQYPTTKYYVVNK